MTSRLTWPTSCSIAALGSTPCTSHAKDATRRSSACALEDNGREPATARQPLDGIRKLSIGAVQVPAYNVPVIHASVVIVALIARSAGPFGKPLE